MSEKKEHILVIRLGALGDLIFCFQAFHEIRAAHPGAEIALLVRPAFAGFARSLPWFDRVFLDEHPTAATPHLWLRLRRALADFAPARVYDLQGKRRQSILYALLGGPWGPQWSGAAPYCALPRPWPPAPGMHFTDFLAAQLRAAKVPALSPPDLSWLDAPVDRFALPQRYVVLIPGCSPGALHKRWPAASYAVLAQKLVAKGLACVIVGTDSDQEAAQTIKAQTPEVIDLCGKTSLSELAGILRRATGVIGNDTGPVHMAGALATPVLALFSGKSNPVWSHPPGPRQACLQRAALAELDVGTVLDAFDVLTQHAEQARA